MHYTTTACRKKTLIGTAELPAEIKVKLTVTSRSVSKTEGPQHPLEHNWQLSAHKCRSDGDLILHETVPQVIQISTEVKVTCTGKSNQHYMDAVEVISNTCLFISR